MIDLDILFVTYRSEKWIEGCVSSLAASDYDLYIPGSGRVRIPSILMLSTRS